MLIQVLQSYSQPTCVYGNVYRTREQLDQVLRCAEVMTPYISALTISSFAARENEAVSSPPAFIHAV